ncbi:MAG: fibronectin type III domain-containing protein [Lapillicoccus sp.]
MSRARRIGAVSTVLVLLLGTALVWFALRADGDVVRKTDLFDGGVWVTNAEQARFGRLNKPAGQLDAGIAAPGTQSSGLDIVQEGAAVLGVSKASNQLLPINPKTATLSDSSQITLPAPQTAAQGTTAAAVLDLRGGSLAIADPAKGSVWAQRVDPRTGISTLEQLQPSQKPRAVLGGDTVVAVGPDGTVYAASGTKGDLATFTVAPGGSDFLDPVVTKLGFTTAALQLTAVGSHWVALDGTTGKVLSDAAPQPVSLGTITGAPVLQQPGPDAAGVLVQTGDALLRVPFAGGALTRPVAVPPAGVTGLVASQPVALGACLHAAWAGRDSVWYGRSCTTDPAQPADQSQQSQTAVQLGTLTKGVRTDGVKLRVNRGLIALNDLDSGNVWDVTDKPVKVDNWDSVIPPPQQEDQNQRQDPNEQDDQIVTNPPQAQPDELNVRPGRTSSLHVLDNDSDSQGSILGIAPGDVSAPDAADVSAAVSVDGQTVEITVPANPTATTFRFSYTVNNGSSGQNSRATGSVVVHVVDDSVNSPPFVRGGQAKLAQAKYPVVRNGHVTVGVVADWRDGENDPLSVDSGDPAVGVDPSGALGVTAPDNPGTFPVKYSVGDGHGGSSEGQAGVTVLADDARAEPPQTQPDVIRAVVGKPVQVQPLGNDVPGADPTDPAARMRLATDVRGPGALVIDTNLDTNVLTVTGSTQGTYLVTYAAQVGSAVAAGRIRVDILPNPSDDQPPVAAPDAATVRDQEPIITDVLSNDYSPRSDVLVVQKAVADVAWLQPSVVQGRWVRVQAASPLTSPQERRGSIDYVVSDGTKTATGHVSVVQKPRPEQLPLPNVECDEAVFRLGDVVTIPVLDNDTMSGGVPLKLQPQAVKVVAGKGQAFASGSVIRYIPDVTPITADDVVTLEYATYPEGSPDRAVTGRITVTVKPLPTPTTPNQPPTARSVTASVTAGDTITITVPTSGIDPDGDLTYVAGIVGGGGGGGDAVDLSLGRVTSFGATTVKYEAYPRGAGTEVIRYVVRDRFGATSEAFIRVGVVQPGDPQPPIAVLDDIVAAPGRSVNADVLANDLISPDDEVTFTDLTKSNEPAALEQFTKLDDNTFRVIAPEEGPAKVLAYAITDGLFDPSRATLTVRGQKGFDNPPTALDDTATPKPGETDTLVDVLANDRDIDGDPTTLQLVEAVGEGVTVVGRQVRIQLLDHPRVVPYIIADADGAKAMALVYVPTADNGAPYVTPGKVVQMDTNGTATVDIGEYITDPRGRTVKVTSPDTVSASPKDVLTAEPQSDTSIKLTAGRDYNGPAALILQVTDATGSSDGTADPSALTAYVSILVQIGPKLPILRCPDYLVNLVGGGEPRTVDIPRLCHAWLPTGLDPATVEYTASWAQPVPGVDLKPGGTGNREVTLSAAPTASGDGSMTVAAKGSTESFPIRVHATPTAGAEAQTAQVAQQVPPLVIQPITIAALNAGSSQTVNVAPYLQSPLSAPQCSVSSFVTVRSGTGISGSGSGCSVTVNASKDARGAATLVYEASDGPGRQANGEIRVTVRGAPDAPQRVSATADRVAGGLARVSWSPPATDGGLSVLQYEVAASTGQRLTCPAAPCTVSGLKNGVPVSFTVRARNAVDWSPPSVASQQVTPDTAPRAVSVGTVTPGDRTLAVTWAAPVNEGSAIDQYQVQWVNTSGGAGGGTRVVSGGTLSTTLSALVNDNQYSIRVQAHNGAGWGAYGPAVVKQSVGTPAAVAAPRLAARTPNANDANGQVTITWGTTDPNGPPITTYTIYRRVGGGAWASIGSVSGTASRTLSNTMPYDGRTYEYMVTATNGGGKESPKTNASPYRATGIPVVPGAPKVVESGFDYLAKVTVTLGDSRASSFTSVKWRSSGGDSGTWSCGGCGDGVTKTFTTTKLPTTVQSISVQACNDATPVACSGWSGGSSVHPYGPTPAVSGLASKVTGTGGDYTITWTWNNVSNGRAYDSIKVSGAVDRTLGGSAESVSLSGVGYSQTKSVTLVPTVTTPQGSDAGPSKSDSATTPDKPPVVVTVRPGSGTCGLAIGKPCPQPGVCNTTCNFIAVQIENSSGTWDCNFSDSSGYFADQNVQADGSFHQTGSYYGGHGQTLTARCTQSGVTKTDSYANWP